MNENLKQAIDSVIKKNGLGEITGPVLNNVLMTMVDFLSDGSSVKGLATLDTNPGTPDGPVVYFIVGGVTYPNFGGITPPKGLNIVYNQKGTMSETIWKFSNLLTIDAQLQEGSGNPIANDAVAKLAQELRDADKTFEGQIKEIQLILNDYAGQLKNISEFNGVVEKHMQDQKVLNGQFKSNIQSLDGDVNANRTDIKTNSDKIAALATASDKHEANLETLNKDNGKNKADIVALQTDVEKKAYRDGYYPEMTSGRADNLIGGIDVSQKFNRGVVADGKAIDGKVGRIQKYKGNSVVMNQLTRKISLNDGSTLLTANSYTEIGANVPYGGQERYFYYSANIKCVSGSVGLIMAAQFDGSYNEIGSDPTSQINTWERRSMLKKCTGYGSDKQINCRIRKSSDTETKFYVKDVLVIDLTQMFGAGNEPSTPEEFESMFQLPYYDYNEGTIVNYNATGIKSVGFNQWDEQWINGVYGSINGELQGGDQYVASKDLIPILPNTKYYASVIGNKSPLTIVTTYYKGDKSYLTQVFDEVGRIITPPTDARFMHFHMSSIYGNVYKNDICINISDPAHNGEYHPYMESTKMLDIQSIKGEDGQPLFPNGLCSAGNVHDEITATKAIKRVGTFKIKDKQWDKSNYGGTVFDLVNFIETEKVSSSVISTCYIQKPNGFYDVPYCMVDHFYNSKDLTLRIREDRYADVSEFVNAMGECEFLYELAEPIVVDLPNPLNVDIAVENKGTLSVIPEETPTPTTAPASLDMSYSMDVVGAVKGLPQDYISKASMENFLGQLGQAQGGTWNMVWDAETGKYNFNFAKTASIDVPPESVQE